MAATAYTFVKSLPINFTVLTNQIDGDSLVGTDVLNLGYDGGTETLTVTMLDALTGPQLTELGVLVTNHNGITKSFNVPFPITMIDDFITSNASSALGWTSSSLTSGVLTLGNFADQDHPGIVRVGSGNLVTGAASYHLGLHDLLLGGGAVNIEFGLRINQLGGPGNRFVMRVGLGDLALGVPVNGCWVEYNLADSPNWAVIASNEGSQTEVTSSTAVDIGWHKFSLQISADGTTCMFFIDDAYISTIDTNLPTGSCGPIIQMIKTLGTNPANVDVDYFYMSKDTNRT